MSTEQKPRPWRLWVWLSVGVAMAVAAAALGATALVVAFWFCLFALVGIVSQWRTTQERAKGPEPHRAKVETVYGRWPNAVSREGFVVVCSARRCKGKRPLYDYANMAQRAAVHHELTGEW